MINHCDICGEKLVTVKKIKSQYIIGMADDYTQHVKMCPRCHLIVTGNPFSEEQLNNRYTNFSKFEFDAETYVFDVANDYKLRCVRQKNFIEENIPNLFSMLEIGASSGYNLSIYKNTERRLLGIEPSRVNCDGARKNYGLDMFCGVFNDYYHQQQAKPIAEREKYDMVFLSHTLEHIVNPCTFIKQCVEAAQPEYFFIEIPTFDFKFVNEPYGIFCEEHVNYFTLESLENLMQSVGFSLMEAEIRIEPGSRLPAGFPSLISLWKKSSNNVAPHHYVNSVSRILEAYNKTSEKELKRIKKILSNVRRDAKLAVWGTGHHVSMLLANTALPKKNIVKFYDSDTKKHAFQIAGKPIMAFNPQDIEDGTIDTILIATYVAQPTLLRILEPYKNKCNIITLYEA